ncbi:MAG TPA: lysine--tRNA ligase [Pyrinomonadaceae bacterium]|nr:lysine--tRNA ligase [Pyrinomonadaceae bacterium]
MTENNTTPFIEDNDQTRARREHLEKIQQLTGNAYPNKFGRSNLTASVEGEDTISSVVAKFKGYEPPRETGGKPAPEQLEAANTELRAFGDVRLSGRLAVPPRVMGKAAFVHLSDGRERLQIYVRRDDVRPMQHRGHELDGWELFSLLDHGDFIGVEGFLFITKTGELSVHVHTFEFLTKALLPMPDKMHGISDPEIRQRQRYADLIAGSLKIDKDEDDTEHELTPREVFERRSKIIREMRNFLDARGYIEVETPMLSPIASGAAARPFKTHHNALGIDLYARIAPELYLKRLLVGGFERVYELNRNFRNEGIDRTHNPEFTMLEFYCAYMDVNGMMDFCEEMLRQSVVAATGGTVVSFEEQEYDFGRPFERVSMREIVRRFAPDVELTDENLIEMFETHAEPHLGQPTFIVDYPKSISPLSKASPDDPSVAERFELYINGMECANGFSELNDPVEQYERFKEQAGARERGDEEAMQMDTDYVRALAYGMPPAAGIGIGIDRIVMLLTNRRSIRDVILFPHMRPVAPKAEETDLQAESKDELADGAEA